MQKCVGLRQLIAVLSDALDAFRLRRVAEDRGFRMVSSRPVQPPADVLRHARLLASGDGGGEGESTACRESYLIFRASGAKLSSNSEVIQHSG